MYIRPGRIAGIAAVVLTVLSARAAAAGFELSLMTYNIYYGGQPHDPVLERGHEWLRVLEDRHPDVILIQEANGWLPSEQNLIAAYLDSLNSALPGATPYTGFVADANSLFNLALLSRLPVLDFEEFRVVEVQGAPCTLRHVFYHAALDAGGERVHVVGAHFRPGWYERVEREFEARALLTILDGLPAGEKVWVAGDFNSYSPLDVAPGSPTPPNYEAGAPPADTYGWEPAGYLLERGFRDAFRAMHPLDLGYTKETCDFLPHNTVPRYRVDFVLDSPGDAWSLDASEVVRDGPAGEGSDHYAVCAVYRRPDAAGLAEGSGGGTFPVGLLAPNPLRVPGRIHLELSEAQTLTIDLISPEGRRTATLTQGWQPAGRFSCAVAARVGGVYFLRIATDDQVRAVPLLLQP